MGKNKRQGGRQQGPTEHGPGQQGPKTHARQAEIAHTPSERTLSPGPTYDPAEIRAHDDEGKDRLFEDREQHDEAEKNSEKTRLARDVERHHHDSSELPPRSLAKRKS